jgi:hypothetical protein
LDKAELAQFIHLLTVEIHLQLALPPKAGVEGGLMQTPITPAQAVALEVEAQTTAALRAAPERQGKDATVVAVLVKPIRTVVPVEVVAQVVSAAQVQVLTVVPVVPV